MARLPVIVSFGGYNASGRSSFHHGFKRTILESLSANERQQELVNLAYMMKVDSYEILSKLTPEQIEQRYKDLIIKGTLIRKIDTEILDTEHVTNYQSIEFQNNSTFEIDKKYMPKIVPESWHIVNTEFSTLTIRITQKLKSHFNIQTEMSVKSAGQVPKGFKPNELYNSRFHPRGLQLAIVGVSDTINSLGIDMNMLNNRISPQEIGVFSGSIMSQIDEYGFGGMIQARLKGKRTTAKQCPLGLNSMPTDFINAYVLGSIGNSSSVTGACATFLYNLQKAIEQINLGKIRVAIVGNSEAPITIESIDGYAAMSALATEDSLRILDGSETVDFTRASRPFGENIGFTIAESAQYIILMDDELALELGVSIYGCVPEVFVNADGFKRSISAPGIGNYLSVARAVSYSTKLLGEKIVQNNSFFHAHGSSTPANRQTESLLLNEISKTFGMSKPYVTAVKAFIGHSLATASADQLISALGSFAYNIIPGIKTTDKLAHDVVDTHLNFALQDTKHEDISLAFINSKGFGGNNATAPLINAATTMHMLTQKHGETSIKNYLLKNEHIQEKSTNYESCASIGDFKVIYQFGKNPLEHEDVHVTLQGVKLSDGRYVEFNDAILYQDMKLVQK